MRPVFITFPTNVNQVVEEGSSSLYNCTVISSNRTKLQWLFEGVAVPECQHGDMSPLQSNVCTSLTTSTTEGGLAFVHSIRLHIFDASVDSSGQYSCKVQGITDEIVQQNNLIVQQTIEVTVNPTDDHNNDKRLRNSQGNKSDDANWIIILLVSISAVLICVLSALLISALVKVLLYMRRHQNAKMTDESHEINLTSPTTSEDGKDLSGVWWAVVKFFS